MFPMKISAHENFLNYGIQFSTHAVRSTTPLPSPPLPSTPITSPAAEVQNWVRGHDGNGQHKTSNVHSYVVWTVIA